MIALMITGLVTGAFGGGHLVALYILSTAFLRDGDRILAALHGKAAPQPFLPLAGLVRAERRIAVRRWAAGSSVRSRPALREAA